MPQEIILDTSALIAFFIPSEINHEKARKYVLAHSHVRWIILETVFNETVTWLRIKVPGYASIQVGEILRSEHHYVNISDKDDQSIWEFFCRFHDKKWSYTDCSIAWMSRSLRIPDVFSFDHHIRQMQGLGINCVPE